MKKISYILLVLTTFVISGCSSAQITEKSNTSLPTENKSGNELIVDSIVENGIQGNSVIADELKNLDELNFDELQVKAKANEDSSSATSIPETKINTAIVKYDKEGAVVVNSGINLSQVPEMELSQWCIEGKIIQKEIDETSNASFTMMGIKDFKSEDHCHLSGTIDVEGMNIVMTIYSTGANSDFWVITELMGQSIEQKVKFNQ